MQGQGEIQELLSKKHRFKPGNLEDLKRLLWRRLKVANAVCDEVTKQGDYDLASRWTHNVNALAQTYDRVLNKRELQVQIEELEERVHSNGHLT